MGHHAVHLLYCLSLPTQHPSSWTSWFAMDFWHISEAKRAISCQLHLGKLLNTIFLAWEMFLWPFEASLLWCLRTWLQAVKPPWPGCQGGNCYRRLSWARTSTSGTASPTDYPAQKAGHLAKGPTRTACACMFVHVSSRTTHWDLASNAHQGREWKDPGIGQLSWNTLSVGKRV